MRSRSVVVSPLAALLLAMCAAAAMVAPVAAGDFRGEQTVVIDAGQTIDDDLYIGAGTTTIAGTVTGDATVAGGTVTITGRIEGSLNVAGGTVDVAGDVDGAVRVAGGTVRISGDVGRDLVLLGGAVTVGPGAAVTGDVAGGVATLALDGTVSGNLLAGGESITINGSIAGDVDATVTDLVIGPSAVVAGDVRYTSAREARIATGADIGGDVSRREPIVAPNVSAIPDNPVLSYLGLLVGLLLIGWTLLAVRPRLVLGSAVALRSSPFPSLGIGFLTWIGQFVLVIVLIVVGVLLAGLAGAIGGAFVLGAILILLLLVILFFVSSVPVAMAIGGLAIPGENSPYLEYLAGAAILALIFMLAGLLPSLGAIVTILSWILGLGAFVLYGWRTRQVPWTGTPTGPGAPAGAEPAPSA